MRHRSILSAALLLAMPALTAAHAGTINYANGQTQWEATACQPPTAPSYMAVDGRNNRSGNALSANQEAYNQYTAAVQQFLTCVSTEANQDLSTVSQQVSGQVNQVNQAWMQELQKRQAEMQAQRSR